MCISFHRLCVCASGSLMTSICNFSARIKLSFLHLGQKRGKFINTVSSLIWFRVLCPQAGQSIHSVFIQYAFYLQSCSVIEHMPQYKSLWHMLTISLLLRALSDKDIFPQRPCTFGGNPRCCFSFRGAPHGCSYCAAPYQ